LSTGTRVRFRSKESSVSPYQSVEESNPFWSLTFFILFQKCVQIEFNVSMI